MSAEGPGPRVLMVLKRAGGLGGMQVQAGRVCLRMQERGVPVSLLTQRPDRGHEPVWWTKRLRTHYLPVMSPWGFAREVYRYLLTQHEQYGVVHVHGFGPESFAAIAARRRTGKPLVVKPSTAGPGTKLHAYALWTERLPFLFRPAWRAVDAWASLSDETRDDLLRMGVSPERIVRVPNGVDGGVFRPLPEAERSALRRELGIAPEELLVLSVARLTPHKRVGLLARAFLGLSERLPQARLWVVGYGEQEGEIQALLQGHPAGDRVRLLGRTRSEVVARVMQAADIFVLVSLWEGLSNALLEAMASGLPAVVTNVSGMADVVRDGVSGLVVPPDDEPATRAALERLLTDASLRLHMGEAAARTVQEEYSLDRTVDRLLGLYTSLTSGN